MSPRSSMLSNCRGLLFLMLVLGLIWPSFARAHENFTDKTITSVMIRYRGFKAVNESRIRDQMSVKAGQKFNSNALDDDIKKLYESGLVDDVRILAEPDGDGLILIAEVMTRPGCGAIVFAGNTAFSDKELGSGANAQLEGDVWTDAEILTARRKLETHYHDHCYPDVVIMHRLQSTDVPGMADLVFVIDEGTKTQLRRIRFEGNKTFSDEELRHKMKTKQKGSDSGVAKAGRIYPAQLADDSKSILDFYRNNGFLRMSIDGMERVAVEKGWIDLNITINEGGLYKVKSVHFGNTTDGTADQLSPLLKLAAGQPYSMEKMQEDTQRIHHYYLSRGYGDPVVTPELQDAGPGLVSIHYRIKQGGRFKIDLGNPK